ncbi:MAG: DMT family transporter [bacterium]
MTTSGPKSFLVLGAGIVALSFAAVLIRLTEAPSLLVAAGRLAVASLVLTPFFWSRVAMRGRAPLELRGRKWGWILLAGGLLAAHFVLWIESLDRISVTSSVVLVAMDPIFVAVLSSVLLRERLSLRGWSAIGLGVAGSIVVGIPSFAGGQSLSGNLLALGGAACAGGYLIVGRHVRPQTSLVVYVYLMYTAAALLLIPAVFLAGVRVADVSATAWVFIILLGLGPQLLGHTSFNWALRHLTAPTVAMVILLEPVGAALLSWLILGEPPTGIEAVGGAIILAGVYLVATARPPTGGGFIDRPSGEVTIGAG